MSDTGLENGLGEANMSGWGEKTKEKKGLSYKPVQEGIGPTNSLFLQIFNTQKFNIQATKICPNRELT